MTVTNVLEVVVVLAVLYVAYRFFQKRVDSDEPGRGRQESTWQKSEPRPIKHSDRPTNSKRRRAIQHRRRRRRPRGLQLSPYPGRERGHQGLSSSPPPAEAALGPLPAKEVSLFAKEAT